MKKRGEQEKEKSNKDYWKLADKVSKEVAQWPDWKKNVQVGYTYSTNTDTCLSDSSISKKKPRVCR